MKRKSYIFPLLFAAILLFTTSCLDDDNNTSYDVEWKSQNENAFQVLGTQEGYTNDLSSFKAPPYYVRWKESNKFEDVSSTLSIPKITSDGKPEFTDTVYVRYDGWFINFKNNNDTIRFDSTEWPITGSTSDPNKISRKFAVSGVIDGWTTILMDMKVGEEREVAIPWQLGYGGAGSSLIPGYTTLRFTIKLEKIIPMKGKS